MDVRQIDSATRGVHEYVRDNSQVGLTIIASF